MPYDHTPEAEIALRNAMADVHANGHSDRKVVSAINKWSKKETISESHYNNFRKERVELRGSKAALIYSFFEQSDEIRTKHISRFGIDATSDIGGMAAKAMAFFRSDGYSFPYAGLDSFIGEYTLYRKSWLKGAENYYIQNLIKIKKVDGVFTFEEMQRHEFGRIEVFEEDLGFIFPYSTNFVALTNSTHSMKYFVIHDMFPEPRPRLPVQSFEGNMIAVAGGGPHPSSKFVCVRKEHGLVDLGIHEFPKEYENKEKFDFLKDIM